MNELEQPTGHDNTQMLNGRTRQCNKKEQFDLNNDRSLVGQIRQNHERTGKGQTEQAKQRKRYGLNR